VHIRPNTYVKNVIKSESEQQLIVTFSNGEKITINHLIAATGFKYSIDKLDFLHSIAHLISRDFKDYPRVNMNFESNIAGLHFAGPSVSYSHGPTYKF